MFENPFSRRRSVRTDSVDASKAAAVRQTFSSGPASSGAARVPAIAAQRTCASMAGVKAASKEISRTLMKLLKSRQGVPVETLFGVLGSLAGFSCQMGIRDEYSRRANALPPLHVVRTLDGRVFYFGDALNEMLAESQYSVWSLSASHARKLGGTPPDLSAIFAHVSRTCGGTDFGVPRFPEGRPVKDLPVDYIKTFWSLIQPAVQKHCNGPSEWHVAYGLAIQAAMDVSKAVIDPGAALEIVMECAVPMSKLDPREVGL